MEVASGVLSILTFALQALKAVQWLEDFCEEYGRDRKAEFLNDLATTAAHLTDVKTLCESIQEEFGPDENDYRLGALEIQVQDCAAELQGWLRLAKKLKSPPEKNERQHLVLGPLRNHWAKFVQHASASSRGKLYDRLRWHHQNIAASLQVVGAKFDVAVSKRIVQVEELTEATHAKLCEEAGNLASRLDSLTASSDSVEAHSRDTSERLRDVRTETSALTAEIVQMKAMLVDVLSSQCSSSQHSETSGRVTQSRQHSEHLEPRRSECSARFAMGKAMRTMHPRSVALRWHLPGDQYPHQRVRRTSSIPLSDTTSSVHERLSADDNDSKISNKKASEEEYRTLLRATDNFIDGLRNLYHPPMAEYIATVCALRTLSMCVTAASCTSSLVNRRDHPSMGKALGQAEAQLKATKLKLSKLRSICMREGFQDDILTVETELSISDGEIAEWNAARDSCGQKPLDLAPLSDPHAAAELERSTRLAEWLLETARATDPLMVLYERIFEMVVTRGERVQSGSAFSNIPGVTFRDMWKYWFMDSSLGGLGTSGASVDGATIQSGLGTIVGDPPVVGWNSVSPSGLWQEEWGLGVSASVLEEAQDTEVASGVEGHEDAVTLLRLVETPTLRKKDREELGAAINECPVHVNEDQKAKARRALEAYREEQAAAFSEICDDSDAELRSLAWMFDEGTATLSTTHDFVFRGYSMVMQRCALVSKEICQ